MHKEFQTNYRLWILLVHASICAILSLSIFENLHVFKGYIIPALWIKTFALLFLTLLSLTAMRTLKLTPDNFKVRNVLWPFSWLKALLFRYKDSYDSSGMLALFGTVLFRISYAFLDKPIVSDPCFTAGSIFLILYTISSFIKIKKGTLFLWAIIACLYLISGIANCYITFCM